MFSNQNKDWKSELAEIDEYLTGDYSLSAIQQHISYEIRTQNEIIVDSNNLLSNDILNGISESTNQICGTLDVGFSNLISTNEKGFNQLSSDLNQIDNSINELGNILHWGFSETIEQIRTSNILLGNITVLLRIPEFQKESEAYLKEGMKFFKNAMFNRNRYSDALENFLLAEEKAKTNYYLLQKIGLIYLYSKEHINVNLALKYFLKASDYSLDETHDNSVKTDNYLNKNSNEDFKVQANNILDIKTQTAYSYLYAGRCYYILKNYSKAFIYASKAFELLPSLLEAGYDKAKYLSIDNQVKEATIVLKGIIENDRHITLKILNDIDLIGKKRIQEFLKEITNSTASKLKRNIDYFNGQINSNELRELIESAKEQLNKKTYLNYRKGLDILSDSQNFYIPKLVPIVKRLDLWEQKYENVVTTPEKLYKYEQYTLPIKEKLLKYRTLYYADSNTSNDLQTDKEKLDAIVERNKDNGSAALTGAFMVIIPIIALYLIFTLNGVLGIIIWLILLGYPIGLSFVHGLVHLGQVFSIQSHKEKQAKARVDQKSDKANQYRTELQELKGEIHSMDLSRLESIL